MDTTDAIEAHVAGDRKAISKILPHVYQELRRLAASFMLRERPSHTLQPTALVHEAYIRLVDNDRISFQGKTHFYAIAAEEMRRVLVEHARRHGARKRGGGRQRITLDEGLGSTEQVSAEVLDLDDGLRRLHALNSRQAKVAELRFFAGMNVRETAAFLNISERTVKGEWRIAKAWLLRELSRSPEASHGPCTP
jgi:RNA polymerase sigma factor (TIGR02999 family)